MKFDYTSMGFYTFDCLGRPVDHIPPGAGTYFIDELTLAVSGAAGSASIVAAKYGLSVQAVGGVGKDDMGDWVLMKLASYGVDIQNMQRCEGVSTSSSIVTTRPNGDRPALHKKGATGSFFIDDAALDRVIDTKVFHVGGVGLMDRMDQGRTAEVMKAAKARGCITTLDVFASTPDDLRLVEPLLPNTDYFLPSEEEAGALSGLSDRREMARFFLERGVNCVVLTLGPSGAYYLHSDGTEIEVPAFDIDIVCTCGCGDCFNAGFATGLLNDLGAETAIRLAQATSAQNATGLGSQAGVTDLAGSFSFIENTPVKTDA